MSSLQFPTETDGYPEPNKGSTALVLGILALLFLAPLAPFAWVMAKRELEAIEEGRRSPAGASSARAGRILGIIGTVFLGLGLLVTILLIAGVLDFDTIFNR